MRGSTRRPQRRVRSHGPAAALLAALAGAAGCASLGPLPSRPEPVPYADTLPIPEPAERDPIEVTRLFKQAFGAELMNPIDLRKLGDGRHEALNLTHFDDVVNSAWFEHRNGRQRMTPEEVARGPATGSGPDTSAPLTIISGKSEGISPGFNVRDSRGDVYVLKFDPKGSLHLASSADVVSSRLFYAAGYHVPEDHIVVFDSARLSVGPDARITTERGRRRMNRDDVREILARTDTLPDGRYLALASKFLPGTPKGPFFFEGVRSDDPNDYYHHQYRRELRGLYVMSAWLNHVDMRFGNTLDVYVESGYLRHYLIDFAASLGSGTIRPHSPREGREYNFDLWPSIARLVTLGFFDMGWEDVRPELIHPSIGWMPVQEYDPAGWKANWPNPAFSSLTTRDGYWGAKLVGSITDEQIRAVVAEARLPDPAAADTLFDILAYRRDRTVAYWYSLVTPIENVAVEYDGDRLADGGPHRLVVAFDDLGIRDDVWTADSIRYEWTFDQASLRQGARGNQAAGTGPRQTVSIDLPSPGPGESPARDELAVLKITSIRSGARPRPTIVYLQWSAGDYRVVGLEH